MAISLDLKNISDEMVVNETNESKSLATVADLTARNITLKNQLETKLAEITALVAEYKKNTDALALVKSPDVITQEPVVAVEMTV